MPSFTLPHNRRVRVIGLLLISAVLALVLVRFLGPSEYLEQLPRLKPSEDIAPSEDTAPADSKTEVQLPPITPPDYETSLYSGSQCDQKLSEYYLQTYRNHSASYCASGSNSDSKSQTTCFHSERRSDGNIDSMCYVQGAGFNVRQGKFTLPCHIRDLSEEELKQGLVQFRDIRAYWYETGPPVIFDLGINVHDPEVLVSRNDENSQQDTENGDSEPAVPTEQDAKDVSKPSEVPESPPRNYLLLKREGEGNLWHCLLEIYSAWMSFDILRISPDPSNNGAPFFQVPDDVPDTQVVILDDRDDGPYFDLWTLFASRKPLRMKQLVEQVKHDESAEAKDLIKDVNLIVPLAGSGNPLWQDDWDITQCHHTSSFNRFVQRILDHYRIPDPEPRVGSDPIRVTFIDRVETRRLVNHTAMFEELKNRNPYITVQAIDFAAISFTEQLRVIRNTDVLVGVHGAGLTHGMFMRQRYGAVVEIQPTEVTYHMFRNMALLRGLSYFRVHAPSVPKQKRELVARDDWHFEDVQIETDRLLDVVESAIKSLYTNGIWDHDVN